MSEFNKGDIVYPTAEYRENVREENEIRGGELWEGDTAVLNNEPLRVIGETEVLVIGGLQFAPAFIVTVPASSTRESFSTDEFLDDPSGAGHRDVILVLEHEIEHDGGVLAGV